MVFKSLLHVLRTPMREAAETRKAYEKEDQGKKEGGAAPKKYCGVTEAQDNTLRDRGTFCTDRRVEIGRI